MSKKHDKQRSCFAHIFGVTALLMNTTEILPRSVAHSAVLVLVILSLPCSLGAWCAAMGGYPSFEAQAAAQKRATASYQRQSVQRSIGAPRARRQDNSDGANLNGSESPSTQGSMELGGTVDQAVSVFAAQRALTSLGFYAAELDGIPSPAFGSAVNDFRKANGQSGGTSLDSRSWSIIREGNPITKDLSDRIIENKKALMSLGYYTGELDGHPSPWYLMAFADFRNANALANSTSLDQVRQVLHGGNAVTKWASQREMKRKVIENQAALKELGFYSGDLDGLSSPAYRAAFSEFRKANGILNTTPSGEVWHILHDGKAVKKQQTGQLVQSGST